MRVFLLVNAKRQAFIGDIDEAIQMDLFYSRQKKREKIRYDPKEMKFESKRKKKRKIY